MTRPRLVDAALADIVSAEQERYEHELAQLQDLAAVYERAVQIFKGEVVVEAGEPRPSVAAAQKALAAQTDRCREAEDRLRRARGERVQDPAWEKRRTTLTRDLRNYYGEYGPHYDMLIRRLVTAEILTEQMEENGRAIDAKEFRHAAREVREAVAALQKYTEAQKTEVVRQEVNDGIRAAIQVIEEVIAPVQPSLWNTAVQRLVERVDVGA